MKGEKDDIDELDRDIEYCLSFYKKAELVINVSRDFSYYLVIYGNREQLKINNGELYYKDILVTIKRSVRYQFQVLGGAEE